MNRSTIVSLRWLPVIATCALLSHVATAAEPRAQYEQTQNGVTVRIEKISFERILNEPAWLRQLGGADWQQKFSAEELSALLPGKVVTFSVSITSNAKVIGHGVKGLEFAKDLNQKYTRGGSRAFGSPHWKPRIDPLPVDPNATGFETWRVVGPKAQIQDLFPAKLIVEATTEGRRNSTFVFEQIEF
jgi:hypothetical protein